MTSPIILKLIDDIERLAEANGFSVAFDYVNQRISVLRPGIDPFVGSLPEALAYLQGWDRCARHEGRS